MHILPRADLPSPTQNNIDPPVVISSRQGKGFSASLVGLLLLLSLAGCGGESPTVTPTQQAASQATPTTGTSGGAATSTLAPTTGPTMTIAAETTPTEVPVAGATAEGTAVSGTGG